jgi:ELWxxDGT repeat protein
MSKPRLSLATMLAVLLAAAFAGPVAASQPPHLLEDLRPGFGNPFAEHFTTVGNRVFFDAEDGVHGRELFVSDGTVDGTHMVKDIYRGSGSGLRFDSGLLDANSLTAVGDRLFFVARDGSNGTGLYVTDGTSAGTQRVVRRQQCDAGSLTMVAVGTRVLFAAADAAGACNLYVSDGTKAGTVLVARAVPSFQKPVLFNNRVFFLARNDQYGSRLWKTTTVPGGQAKKIQAFRGQVEQLVVSGQRLFMNPGNRLFVSDGTAAGTQPVARTIPITAQWLIDVDGTLVFQSFASGDFGVSIWRTRGTTASTRLLKDLGPDGGSSNWGGYASDHHAYFNTWETGESMGLWASDGTVAGTRHVGDMRAMWATSLGDRLYFGGCDDTCYPAFTSDGTLEGTYRFDGTASTVQLGAAGETVFMAVEGELWVYVP